MRYINRRFTYLFTYLLNYLLTLQEHNKVIASHSVFRAFAGLPT